MADGTIETKYALSGSKRVPAYCEECGRNLDVIDRRTKRYDMYTGDEILTGIIEYNCPESLVNANTNHTRTSRQPEPEVRARDEDFDSPADWDERWWEDSALTWTLKSDSDSDRGDCD